MEAMRTDEKLSIVTNKAKVEQIFVGINEAALASSRSRSRKVSPRETETDNLIAGARVKSKSRRVSPR
jgi:hypothetical protein